MILFGVLFGRWWRPALVAAVVVWPVILVVSGAMSIGPGLAAGAALGLINAAAGVALHQAGLHLIRFARRSYRRSGRVSS
ncbi:hypothetical protein [Spelaeicoccus albus]|nr:hypothetical protein [Spelaeicoccus albus]